MEAFLDLWFADWLTVTIPNGKDGKGTKLPGPAGVTEMREAERRLVTWATVQGLHRMRLGKGSDGYAAGMHFADDPVASERMATVRSGHATNMPGLELPGADGACGRLAPAALDELGPVLLARMDVALDVSQPGLMDDLHAYAVRHSGAGMDPPRVIESASGRTWSWGKGEASVKVYQKDLERVHDGKLGAADADPDLTRIEFTFRPTKGRKAGFARIARDEGPGALLATTLWVRRMVEHIARITDCVKDARLGIQRVERTPDPRTVQDRADHGLAQYGATFCKAAAADLVARDHGGDWLAAEIEPEKLVEHVVRRVRRDVSEHARAVVSDLGLDQIRAVNQEAERQAGELVIWMRRQEEETQDAQDALTHALARVRSGRPALVPEAV